MGKARIIVLAGATALILAGCMRQSALYEINPDGTVDARITVSLQEEYTDATQPNRGIPVQAILDHYVTDVMTTNDYGTWLGYQIILDNEPMSSFADPATLSWDLQILGDDSDWVVNGMEYDSDQDGQRQAIVDSDGYLDIAITFPGDLVEENGAVFTMYPAPGVAQWNMATITEKPYARGRMPVVDPPDPPDPDPVVTVVITPDPDPVVTPNESPSASPSTPASAAMTTQQGSNEIPVWIWGVGALLLASVVGLGTYVLTSKSRGSSGKDEGVKPEGDGKGGDDA